MSRGLHEGGGPEHGESPARRSPRAPESHVGLSTPHLTGEERTLIEDVLRTSWLAPFGPHVDAFEKEFAASVGTRGALAVNSGTAALHLALRLVDVQPGDIVLVSTFTFAATVFPILYLGARPVFIDSEPTSWNMDPDLLQMALETLARMGRLPRAVVVVHGLGQVAEMDAIVESCRNHGVVVIEDAAEALGATYRGRAAGTFGRVGIYSFNGDQVITTGGGGMLVSDESALIEHGRKLASQARDAAPHHQHSEVGYNYRLSNLLAAVGRAQLHALDQHVAARRSNFEYYSEALADLHGIEFQPELPSGRHSRWLTAIQVDPQLFGADREAVRLALAAARIEARPLFKPMHQQPAFREFEVFQGDVADRLFRHGLCLPSGSNLTAGARERVVSVMRRVHRAARSTPLL